MLTRLAFVGFLATMISASGARAAALDDVAPDLREKAECMLKALSVIPNVSEDKLLISSSGGWVHPQLEYQYTDKLGETQIVVFTATRSYHLNSVVYSFWAALPGLFTPGTAPNDWGTSVVVDQWNKQCGANANVLYE